MIFCENKQSKGFFFVYLSEATRQVLYYLKNDVTILYTLHKLNRK